MGTDWLENVMNSWFPHSWAMASDTDEQTYQIMVQQWKSTEDWAVAFWKRHTVKLELEERHIAYECEVKFELDYKGKPLRRFIELTLSALKAS